MFWVSVFFFLFDAFFILHFLSSVAHKEFAFISGHEKNEAGWKVSFSQF